MAIARWSETNDIYLYKSGDVYIIVFPEFVNYSYESFEFLSLLDKDDPLELEIAQTQIRRMELVDSDYYRISDLKGTYHRFDTSEEVLSFLQRLQEEYPKVKIEYYNILHRLEEGNL